MIDDYSFGEWIRKRRRALGLTQEALAAQVGYSAAMLRKIESDERRPSSRAAALLAAALAIPPEQHDAFLNVARQERTVDRLGAVDQTETYPWQAPPRPRTNLPLPATLFVGREKELARLAELLADPACRLVTVVGLAGIGKTRLAVQAAHSQVDRFADGVFFVSLAPLSSPDLIVATIANAIGIQFRGTSDPQEQLLRYLQGKRLLLVLDNFEHLVGRANLMAEIAQTAAGVQLLVTSRERLNLQGEWVVEVPGLSYPAEIEAGSLEELPAYEAVQLLLQSALRVDPRFSLNEENRDGVVRICRLTQGVPLGLELAAAWVRVLSCQEIAREIESNLDFLKASAVDLPERHRSLRAALDHSWALLTAEEKAVFRRLSVFRGGFRRKAAQEVAGASLELLVSLLDKSLLKRMGQERYDLHELVRQYAAAHLQSNPEEDAETQDRHSGYYVSLLEQWAEGIRRTAQKAILAEMDLELENVRLAWSHIIGRQRPGMMNKSLGSLRNYYEMRARFQEGAELFHEGVAALEMAHDTEAGRAGEHAVVLGRLLTREAYFYILLDRYDEAADLLDRSLAHLRPRNDRLALADTLAVLGYMHSRMGRFLEARQSARESLALNREIGKQIGIAFCLRTLAHSCLALGAYEEAQAYANESLAICRERLGDPHGTAICLITLSAAARHQGKYDDARRWAEEGVLISRPLDDRWCLAQTSRQLGLAHLERGEIARADKLIRQSLALARETGDRTVVASALIALGLVDRASGSTARSQRRFLEALQTAMATKTIPVALQALAEIAVSAMNEGASERALELVTCGRQHPLADARLKTRLDEVRTRLAAQLTRPQVAEIEARVAARPLDSIAAELLDQGKAWQPDNEML